jgi:hypothetical protein
VMHVLLENKRAPPARVRAGGARLFSNRTYHVQ